MENKLIKQIVKDLGNYDSPILVIENNDGFLMRTDVIKNLEEYNINISTGGFLSQRIVYELRDSSKTLCFINQEKRKYLEDIEVNALHLEFFLNQYLPGYHIPSLKDLQLSILDKLFEKKQLFTLSKTETEREIENIYSSSNLSVRQFDQIAFSKCVDEVLVQDYIDWMEVVSIIGNAILQTIGSSQLDSVFDDVRKVNDKFQEYIQDNYNQVKNSNPIKRPQIVSKILDYIDFNFDKKPIALVVIDGLSFWQYSLIKNKLPGTLNETFTFSWIPSITQLSRQAIFRGSNPLKSYRQSPNNESRLWMNYWKSKSFNEFEIKYEYNIKCISSFENVKRLALVYKDLDDYMHTSKDYLDLLKLTENWINRSNIQATITSLLTAGFRVILTSDHGNIQARGWRGLKGKEKLGTNKSGSRSERHIEYTEERLKDEFLNNNPEILNSIVQEDHAIYFKNELSFSRKENLISHGGAHILEVVIPFIEITND